MYVCEDCGKPLEKAIEGELICVGCYARRSETPEEAEDRKAMQHYLTHCQECDRPLPGGGLCMSCVRALDHYWY